MKNKRFILSISLVCGIFVFVLLFDLLSKHFIAQALPQVGDSMNVIPGFINFVYVQNTGAAWGMLAGRPVFLIIVSILILAVYLGFYGLRLKKLKNNVSITLAVSVGLIAGGCIGNLIDRIVFGYVRDFINFQFMDFPVFNIADIALTVGIIIMVIYFIFIYSKEDKKMQTITVQIERFKDMSEIEKLDKEISNCENKNNSNNGALSQNEENLAENSKNSQKNDEKIENNDKNTDNLNSGGKHEG